MRRPVTVPTLTAALVLALVCWGAMAPARAGDGHDHDHDHGGEPPAAAGNGPQRLPDGRVFLPKPAQRQIGVRTVAVATADLPRSHALAGKVTVDPNAGGKVQAMIAGRLEAGPRGLPAVGQAVRKGEVLAYVVPAAGLLERAGQHAQLVELEAARALADKRLARLRQLADSVPQREIEAAESELASLAGRIRALGRGVDGRDALVAPVSGVIAATEAVAGQVIEARELVFEVIDPAHLRIEALAYDGALAQDIAGAAMVIGGQAQALSFIGAARVLRGQALPLHFAAEGTALSALAVGEPVAVLVQTGTTVRGYALPAAAVQKSPANQPVVWVKTGAEHFAPRPVTVVPLDGARVAVTSGLADGERVVTAAAVLVNQIR